MNAADADDKSATAATTWVDSQAMVNYFNKVLSYLLAFLTINLVISKLPRKVSIEDPRVLSAASPLCSIITA